ncbi:sensor histidine kinase [Parasporobacterium paucivorans]|uniref:histidine kinase n=1 Tax=Parasporobacterium paucivorans DSM 15970 TaxID=1122934 RepID=A0A1M6D7N7_9FIRM|nr:ATP-binding protein [Parasporobacterium paucivorans]SHI69209.1 two-component system, OmpR family, phosphate regulon sensor histidine kinase PhoR [Parasporobacterium paucivorans DSM 15970]
MKRRINITFCLGVIGAMLIALFVTAAAFNNLFQKHVLNDLKNYAQKLKETALEGNVDSASELILFSGIRVTLIAGDGKVLFDSETDYLEMENHSDRPEIIEAALKGSGTDIRSSATIGKSTYYYALRLSNGNILRTAKLASNFEPFFRQAVYILVPVMLALVILILILSNLLSKKIIRPIEVLAGNLEDINQIRLYDELVPFARKIKEQQADIQQNMESIRRENNKIHLITRNMSEGIIFLDSQSNILSMNERAVSLLGMDGKTGLGENILNSIRNNEILMAIEKAAQGEHNYVELELEGRQLQFFANPVTDEDVNAGVLCLVLDITEKYNREKLRREFTANVSHELKTPLTSISGYAELIESGMARDEDIKGFAGKIHNESSRLLELINDIIKLSELDEGVPSGEPEEINLLELARDCARSLEKYAQDKRVTIQAEGEELTISGNRRMMHELVYNLAENAIRYNKKDGTVRIKIGRENGKTFILVADTGIGIPAEYQNRIFERFFRVDKSRSKATGGTGLGLSIVKHIAGAHKATLECKSEVGQGTSIKVLFP